MSLTPSTTDAALIRAEQDDASAPTGFDALLREHGAAIARLAAAFERNPAHRDDLEQEILLAIWQALPSFRGDSSLKTFVLRIAHNRAVDHVLAHRRRLDREPLEDTLPDPQADPARRASLHQRAEQLLHAVRRLPLAQRELVTLALEGLNHQEIAGILGISLNNVAVRLSRARADLQRQLGSGT